jgi:hypothetical protein
MTLDAKLRWNAHVKKKREELGLKHKRMYWLTGRRSALSMHNKLMLYKQILKPVWAYDVQLWGCTKQNNIDVIHRCKNKVLRNTVDAPWYIRNADLHRDLQIEMVKNETRKFAKKHEESLLHQVNVEEIQLLDSSDWCEGLKKTLLSWCSDH